MRIKVIPDTIGLSVNHLTERSGILVDGFFPIGQQTGNLNPYTLGFEIIEQFFPTQRRIVFHRSDIDFLNGFKNRFCVIC